MWWIIILLIILGLLMFYGGYHLHMKRQFQKKQEADVLLYKKVLNSLNERVSMEEAVNHFDIKTHAQLLQHIQKNTRFPLTLNDRLELLLDGEQTYHSLFEELEKAQHHIHLLFYTIREDEIGMKLFNLLIRKAQEGIAIRILIDGVGSKAFSAQRIASLEQHGIECGIFAPPKLSFLTQLNFRNHRKITVIDGRVGLAGGLNVGDEYLHKDPKKGYWRDIHLLAEGESVLLLQRIFATDWYYVKGLKIEEDEQYFPPFRKQETLHGVQGSGPVKEKTILAQVVPSGPDMERYTIRDAYVRMIDSAQKRVWIGTPYFIPDRLIFSAIERAAQRGVDVTLLVPEKTDNWFVQHAAVHYYQQLLKMGARIYLYKKGFYHAKIALLDDQVAKVGSANIDRRSFYLSFEAGLFIYDPAICEEVQHIFLQDFQDSYLMQMNDLKQRSIGQQVLTSVSLLLAPWL